MPNFNKKEHNKVWNFLIYSKIFFILVLISSGLLVTVIIKGNLKNEKINSEIEELDNNVKNLENENQELENLKAYFESNDFIETEAKRKLGMSKPDEKVVVILEDDLEKSESDNKSQEKSNSDEQTNITQNIKPNYILWWEYYFN